MAGEKWVYEPEITAEVRKLVKGISFADLAKRKPIATDLYALMEKVQTTEPQVIRCPHCGSEQSWKYGKEHGQQVYICQGCHHKFNARGAPYRMRVPSDQIGASIGMFYEGLSLSKIARQLDQSFGTVVNPSSIYRWILRFTKEAIAQLGNLSPKVSDTWQADETVIDVRGFRTKSNSPNTLWLWNVVDEDTRFLISSRLSETRNIRDVVKVMQIARERADKSPRAVITDRLPAYGDGIERVFGSDTRHIQSEGFASPVQTNLVERFNGTVKGRTKVLRGLKTKESAEILIQGFFIHYNFFRSHMSLKNKTPAAMAGIETRCKSWTDVVKGNCRIYEDELDIRRA